MKKLLGSHFIFPALIALTMCLPSGIIAAEDTGAESRFASNLRFLNVFELARLPGLTEKVPVRLEKELTDRLKKFYLEKQKSVLDPEIFDELKERVEKKDFVFDSDQMVELFKDGSLFEMNATEAMDMVASFRLANLEGRSGSEKSPKENLFKLLTDELSRALDNGVQTIQLLPDLTKKLLALVDDEDLRAKYKKGFPTKELLELLKEKETDLDVASVKEALGQVRVDHMMKAGDLFLGTLDERREDRLFKDKKQTPVAENTPAAETGITEGDKTARGTQGLEALPKGDGSAPAEGLGAPHSGGAAKVGGPAQDQSVRAGEGLYNAGGSAFPNYNLSSVASGARSPIIPPGVSGSGDGAANVAGASPVSDAERQKLLSAMKALKDTKGIVDFSVDIFSDFGDKLSKCQATAISKVFEAATNVCRIVFSTAGHCIKQIPDSLRIKQMDNASFAVRAVSSRSEAETLAGLKDVIMVQKPNGSSVSSVAVANADVALLRLNKSGPCPSDSKVPSFEVASAPPASGDGVIVDGYQTLLAGVKKSPEGNSLLEVNLAGNPVGIHEGNSGGGSFVVEEGVVKFVGPLSAKFTSAKYQDRLGLIAADGPVQAWYREELGQNPSSETLLANGVDNDNVGVRRSSSTAHSPESTAEVRSLRPQIGL